MRVGTERMDGGLLLLGLAVLFMLLCAPAQGADWFVPDAALVGQTVTAPSTTVKGVSKVVAEPDLIQQRRVWLDLNDPESRPWFGGSVDVVPQEAFCFGGGYRHDGWTAYAGAHWDW